MSDLPETTSAISAPLGSAVHTAEGHAADATAGSAPLIFQRCDITARYPYTIREYARRTMWRLVESTVFRWSLPRAIGWRCRLLRWFGATLGTGVNVRRTARILHPWLLTMADWSSLADDAVVYNIGPVSIGAHSVVSHGAYLCAGTHDYTIPNLPLLRPPIVIGAGVWICMQAYIGPGVTVGDNTVVGARAVVASSLPPGMVCAGNPARVIKPRVMKTMPANS
jgi:putative colanic acid biosynthesis acetyltransferase WcaF